MPGQRRASLKYQSPVKISELVLGARHINRVIGWFKIGSCDVTCCKEEAMVDPSVIGSIEAAAVASAMTACSSRRASGVLGWASIVTSSVAVSSLRISAWTMVGSCCSGILVVSVLTSWTAVLCCDELPVLRMSSAASWRKGYNQPEYVCIYKKTFRKFQEDELPGWCWSLMNLGKVVLSSWWPISWRSSFS